MSVPYRYLYEWTFKLLKFRDMMNLVMCDLVSSVLCCVVVGLECAIRAMKVMQGMLEVQRSDKASQTCHQDITTLITHHFSSLHEQNYINSVIFKHNWDYLKRGVSCIKDTLNRQIEQDTALNNLNVMMGEIDAIKEMVQNISNEVGRIVSAASATTQCYIPVPPPLPPPGFIITQEATDENSKTISSSDKMFSGDCPPRPFITVETLKQVKLKKVPPMKEKKRNEDENRVQKDENRIQKMERIKSVRIRPNTSDNNCRWNSRNTSSGPPRKPMTSQT